MGLTIADIGMNAANQGLGTIFGMALGAYNDRRQLKQQERLQNLQIEGQKNMTDYNYSKQLQMWKDTNYGAQKAQLQAAGLNPGLLYGMGGGGGATVGGASGSVQGANAPAGGQEIMGMMMQQAQLKLLEAQTRKTNTEADNIGEGGVNRINTELDNIIKKYTGKNVEIDYNVREAGQESEIVAWNNEMLARQGVASNIAELWESGKLKQKSTEEIESILLANAKSREEKRAIIKNIELLDANLKGRNLENDLLNMEKELQEKTGLDKNSNTWLKILGRIFVNYMSK